MIIFFWCKAQNRPHRHLKFWLLVLALVVGGPNVKFTFWVDDHRHWTLLRKLVKVDSHLLKLLDFWLETTKSHWLKKCSQLQLKLFVILRLFDRVTKPFRNLWLVAWVHISRVHQHYAPVVLAMPDYSSNGLVDSASCLLVIPVSTGDHLEIRAFLVALNHHIQVVFLEDHLGIV